MRRSFLFFTQSAVLLILLAGALAVSACGEPDLLMVTVPGEAEEAFARLAEWEAMTTYDGALRVQCRHASGAFGDVDQMDLVMEGRKFRISIAGRESITVFSNGEAVYFYYPDMHEVVRAETDHFLDAGYDLYATNLFAMGVPPHRKDLVYVGTGRVDGEPCFILEYSQPLEGTKAEVLTRLSLSRGSYRLLRREVSQLQDGMILGTRVILYKDFSPAPGGFMIPRRVLIYDEDGGLVSTIVIDHFDAEAGVPPGEFELHSVLSNLSPGLLRRLENARYQEGLRLMILSRFVLDAGKERELLEQAEAAFTAAKGEVGDFPHADYQRARVKMFLGDLQASREILVNLEGVGALRPFALSQNYCELYLRSGSAALLETALDYAVEAVREEKNAAFEDYLAEVLAERTEFQIARGFVQEAMDDFDAVDSEVGGSAVLHDLRNEFLLKLGRYREVVPSAAQRHKEDPSDLQNLLILGDAYEGLDSHEEALELYRGGLETFGDLSVLRLRIGLILLDGDTPALGAATLDDLIASMADRSDLSERIRADYLNEVAYYYVLYNQDLAKAKAYVERALFYFPNDPAYLDTLGWILYHRGEMERALSVLRRAEEREPGNPVILDHLAQALEAAGRSAQAQAVRARIHDNEEDLW